MFGKLNQNCLAININEKNKEWNDEFRYVAIP